MTLLADRAAYFAPFAQTMGPRKVFVTPKPAPSFDTKAPVTNRALGHALAQFPRVTGASVETLAHLRWILSHALEDGMAYATLSSDGDGGAMAQWRAGRSYIALEIGVHEHSFVYSDAEGRLIVNSAAVDREEIRRALRAFTADLEVANPEWRARRKVNGR